MGTRDVFAWRSVEGTSGVRLAEDLDALSRPMIGDLRQHNLGLTLDAARRTPTVMKRWPELAKVRGVEDLPLLPLLTPGDLAAGCPPHSTEFLLEGDGSGIVIRSSGTSGQTKMMFHSWEFKEQVDFLGARGVRAGLAKPPRRVANCMYPAELNGAFFFVLDLTRMLRALCFPLGSKTSVADTATMIHQHVIDTLVSAPAYGTELLTTTPPEQLTSLRNFLYLGEAIGAERLRAITAVAPNLTVRSLAYSTNETGPISYQCAYLSDNTHHIHEDAIVVEVVDEETGAPVPVGTVGELVITPLKDTGMALFRYRIGDRGYLHEETCVCGSQARILTLVGRTAQSITVDVWTISSDHLMSGLARLGVTEPTDCQLQILWDFPNYRIRLLLSPRTPDGITAEAVLRSFTDKYQMHRILTSPRCTSLSVERVDVGQFARTERDKVPVLYQRP